MTCECKLDGVFSKAACFVAMDKQAYLIMEFPKHDWLDKSNMEQLQKEGELHDAENESASEQPRLENKSSTTRASTTGSLHNVVGIVKPVQYFKDLSPQKKRLNLSDCDEKIEKHEVEGKSAANSKQYLRISGCLNEKTPSNESRDISAPLDLTSEHCSDRTHALDLSKKIVEDAGAGKQKPFVVISKDSTSVCQNSNISSPHTKGKFSCFVDKSTTLSSNQRSFEAQYSTGFTSTVKSAIQSNVALLTPPRTLFQSTSKPTRASTSTTTIFQSVVNSPNRLDKHFAGSKAHRSVGLVKSNPVIDVDALDDRPLINKGHAAGVSKTAGPENVYKNGFQHPVSLHAYSSKSPLDNKRRLIPMPSCAPSFVAGHKSCPTFSNTTSKALKEKPRNRAFSQTFLSIEHPLLHGKSSSSIPTFCKTKSKSFIPYSTSTLTKQKPYQHEPSQVLPFQNAPCPESLMLEYTKRNSIVKSFLPERKLDNTATFGSNFSNQMLYAHQQLAPMCKSLMRPSNYFPSSMQPHQSGIQSATYAGNISQSVRQSPQICSNLVDSAAKRNQSRGKSRSFDISSSEPASNRFKYPDFSSSKSAVLNYPISALTKQPFLDKNVESCSSSNRRENHLQGLKRSDMLTACPRVSMNSLPLNPALNVSENIRLNAQLLGNAHLSMISAEQAEKVAARLQVQKHELENRIHNLQALEKQIGLTPQLIKNRRKSLQELGREKTLHCLAACDGEKRKLSNPTNDYEVVGKFARHSQSHEMYASKINRGGFYSAQATSSAFRNADEKCMLCSKKAFFVCSGCRSVWYCSKYCQLDDWSSHCKNCS